MRGVGGGSSKEEEELGKIDKMINVRCDVFVI